jgi:uncharacterized repeat protein (TIGR03943 family)
MRRDVQAIILLLIGGATLRITLGDTYLNYVKEVMRPFLIVAGGLLVLFGILGLLDVLRSSRVPAGETTAETDFEQQLEDELDGHVHGHDHSHGPRAAWFLLLPVLAIFLIAPPALGAFSAARQTTNAIPDVSQAQAPPLPPGDPVPMRIGDYIGRAVWDDGLTLIGRTVEMTGFVTPDPEGGWWLSRMSMACCAADAFAMRISTVDAPDLPANTWVTITGTWVPGGGTQSADAIPLVLVESLVEVPQPRNPYE